MLDPLGDGLAVGHLRRTDVCFHLEFTLHPVDQNVEVKFAHTSDDGLAAFLIRGDAEGWIFGRQLAQRDAQLFLVALGLWLDGELDDRLGELHGVEDHRLELVTQRLAGDHVLQANEGHDVAGATGVNVLRVPCVHLNDSAKSLFTLLVGVHHGITLVNAARVDAGKGVGAVLGRHQLEGERCERLVIGRRTHDFFVCVAHALALNGRNVDRRRQVVDDCVEQGLYALVLERRTTEDREEVTGNGALTDQALDGRLIRLFAFEVGFHDRFVLFDDGLEQLFAVLGGLVLQVVRDVDDIVVGAHGFVVPDHGVHLDEVDHALQLAFVADLQLTDQRRRAEAVLDGLRGAQEVRAQTVELVHEANARHAVAVGLAPYGLGLWLYAGNAFEHGNRAVEDLQRTLNLNGEVHVARSINDVDTVVAPECGGRSGGDGDATLLLLLHPVHGGGTIVHFTDLVGLTSVVQDALGGSGLTGVDVGHDAHVAVQLQGSAACHDFCSFYLFLRSAGRHRPRNLPAVVRERLVGLGHPVRVFPLLNCGPA